MFHSRNDVPFIIGLVDSSPNVAFMVVAKKLNFDLITPNDFVPEGLRLGLCAVWRIASGILCGICVVMAFFWLLDHAAHLSSSASLLCILKHHMFSESPVFHLKLFMGFSLHPKQFSWQLWLKF